jgi:hypothetical protein
MTTRAVDAVGGGQIRLFAATAASEIGWRLLSRNNRECGRGVDTYADAESCRIAVKELQRDIADLERRVRRAEPNRWLWELQLDGVPVAVAGHAFDRLIRCEQAAAQFVSQLAEAQVSPGVVYTAARRWGSVAS